MGFDVLSFIIGQQTGKESGGGIDTTQIDNMLDEINGEVVGETLYNVTFIGADGTELCVVSVYEGDDCQNPVLNGTIERPTKESTEYIDYTFSGWSTTQGGTASYLALSDITKDRTVYAAFTESTRYYTVRFYDGSTLLKTLKTEYGGSLEYNYSKTGFYFNGWIPEPTDIVADMDCYAQMQETNFSSNSWETIVSVAESGKASDYYSIGDEKELKLNYADGTSETVIIRIAGFGVDELSDGTKTGISFITRNALKTPKAWGTTNYLVTEGGNTYAYTRYGFEGSDLRAFFDETLLPALPIAVRGSAKEVEKHYNYYNGLNSNNQLTATMRIFMPSKKELGLYSSYTDANGERYSKLYTSDSERIVTLYDSGEAVPWWTSTVGSSTSVAGVTKNGTATTSNIVAYQANAYVVFGFSI